MPFSVSWHTLLEHLEELPPDATLVTPLSRKPFRITDVQEHRVLIEYREDAGTIPLQREQFETLYDRVREAPAGFDLDRLPPDAEPYATVWSVHPRFEVDDRREPSPRRRLRPTPRCRSSTLISTGTPRVNLGKNRIFLSIRMPSS
jgi:hypothetical protein